MRNYLLLLFSLCAMSLMAQDGVSVQVNAPDNVVAGNDFEVKVVFTKGALKDYSRFSQDLPEGFTAENISSPNADFSFDEQRVRVIWLKLPEEPQVEVIYSIHVHERLSGSLQLGGTFAYVNDGERAYLSIVDKKSVTIMPNPSIDQSLVVDVADFPSISDEPVDLANSNAVAENSTTNGAATEGESSGATGTEAAVGDEVASGSFATIVRQLPQVEPNGIAYINLLVKRPQGTNFLKIEESIPGGYSFESIDAHGAVVSQAASVAKFVWMKAPAEETFFVKYRLVPILERTQEPLSIEGNLTYTDGGQTKTSGAKEMEVNLAAMSSEQRAELMNRGTVPAGLDEVENSTFVAQNDQAAVTPTGATESTKPMKAKAERVSEAYERSGNSLINAGTLKAETGVYFRIQVAAVKNPYFANVFFADYELLAEVKKELIGSYTKYTIGSYYSYEEAASMKKKIHAETPVGKAFIVAYRDGKRVALNSVL